MCSILDHTPTATGSGLKGVATAFKRDTWAPTSRSHLDTTANKIDQTARVVFPTSFLVFNLLYWSYYIREL